jgi:signal transduction histidine kinase
VVFALDEQVARAVSACQASAEQKGLSLRLSAPAGLLVRADRVKLERVLLNLLDNAVKFTETGGVHVEVERSGADVRIRVVDTGIGIPPEHRARLFEEFYQVGNSNRDRRKGFGLGLSVARRLARQLGGDLAVESQLGSGSRFTISLPAVAAGPASE